MPIALNGWALPPFVSALTLFILAGLSCIRGKRRKASLLFSGICLLGALLSLEKALLAILTDPGLALQTSRLDHTVVVFFIPLYLHFTVAFLALRGKRRLIVAAYLFSAVLSYFSQSPYYIQGVGRYPFGFYPRGGILIFVFAAVSSTNTLYCLYLLAGALRNECDPEQRNKIKYIMLGLGGAALMAHMNFLPLMGFHFYPIGNFAFIPLLVLGFAVLKHDLLDIGVAFQKGLLYSVLTGLLTAGYGLAITLFNQFFKDVENRWSLLFSLSLFVMIVFVFEPLKRYVQGGIDELLFKGKYTYQKTLAALSDAMTSMRNIDDIMEKTLKTLTEAMRVQWVYVMLRDNGSERLKRKYGSGPVPASVPSYLSRQCLLIAEMEARKREATRSIVLGWENEPGREHLLVATFNALRGTVIIPMIFKGQVNGLFVLGNKNSGDLFTGEDIELLRTLANQCAVSIDNARAYEVIEALNANLERMVAQRTKQLTKALAQKEKAQELLIRSESLASVGALVAGVAHELNNPLTSVYSLVQSCVETIEEYGLSNGLCVEGAGLDASDREEVMDDLRFSLKELVRAKDIVASLLGLSRQSQEYSEPVRINQVAKDALKILRNQYKHTGISVIEAFHDNLPKVTGNFANLGQVFLNIITNALQAVDRIAGKIVLRTWFDPTAGWVVFECIDNGPGIASDAIMDIFKPFFTTKEVGKGTGLGLYISHEIVRKHDGAILVKNNADGGATFQVALPARVRSKK